MLAHLAGQPMRGAWQSSPDGHNTRPTWQAGWSALCANVSWGGSLLVEHFFYSEPERLTGVRLVTWC